MYHLDKISILTVRKTPVSQTRWDPIAPLKNLAKILSPVDKIPYNFSPTGKLTLISSPFEIQCKICCPKPSPLDILGYFKLENNRISIPIGTLIEIFIPIVGKSETGV